MIKHLLQDALVARRNEDEVAFVIEGKEYSCKQLYEQSHILASFFIEKGFTRNDRVAIYMDNSWETLVGLYAALFAGGTFLIINPQTKQSKLSYILEDSDAKFFVTHSQLKKQFSYIHGLEKKPFKAIVYAGKKLDDDLFTHFESVNDDANEETCQLLTAAIPLDLAALIYTSGTTGDPKGVMMTHRAMTFACDSLCQYIRLDETHKIFCCLPFAFDYGLYQIFMAMNMGGQLIVEKSFSFPAQIFNRVNEYQATVFPGVPTIFAMMIELYKEKPFSLPSVTRITNTAAALPAHFLETLQQIFPNALIFKMYGLTECKRVCYLEPELLHEKPTSVGKAIPGTEVLLLSEDGQPVAPHETGILYVRGGHLMQGYLNKPEQTAFMLKTDVIEGETLLCSHDWFTMDEEGCLYFKGRSDDIIKTRGEKVSPIEVENALYQMHGIRQAAVIGVDDEKEGQIIKAFVSLTPDVVIDERQIKRHCTVSLENFMVPRSINIIDELPLTHSGKISKVGLA